MQGLQLTSRQLVGIDSGIGNMKPAELGGKTVNQAIIEGYAAELTPEAAGMMNILHFVQVRAADMPAGTSQQAVAGLMLTMLHRMAAAA
jgi:hypothetical protein